MHQIQDETTLPQSFATGYDGCACTGWEITKTPPEVYWGAIPQALHSKMHWYNIPVAVDAKSPDNPWNIIKRIFRPGDLVAVKLVRRFDVTIHSILSLSSISMR